MWGETSKSPANASRRIPYEYSSRCPSNDCIALKNVYCHLFGDIVCIATSILLRSVREMDKNCTSNPRISILGSFWKMLSLKVLKLIRKCDSHSLIKTEKNKLMVIVLRYHIFRKVSNNNITYIQKF